MRKVRLAFALVMVLAGVLGSAAFAQDPGWPRQITKQGNTLVYYRPQVDSWTHFQELDWRMAISITPAGGKATVANVKQSAGSVVASDEAPQGHGQTAQ
jgi:hypothetical protein